MRDICVDNFLMICNPDHVERHSDSSDFENPEKILVIAPKGGNHRLLNKKQCNSKHEKQFCNEFTLFHNTLSNNERKLRRKLHRQDPNSHNSIMNYYNFEHSNKVYSFNYKGDDKNYIMEKVNERSLMRRQVNPCLSIIFKRSNNNIKHVANIEKDKTDITNKCNRTYCLNCKRRHMNKLNEQHREYCAQPVYALEENVQTSPFHQQNDDKSNNSHKANPVSEVSYANLSTGVDTESIKKYEYTEFLNSAKEKLEKEIRKEYAKCYAVNDQQQQYPSKLQIKSPYQVYASTSCLVNCSCTEMEGVAKVSSNSSAFWEFFAQKMNSKIQNQEACECAKLLQRFNPTTCKCLSPAETPNKYNYDQINTNSCCQQTQASSSDSNASTKKKNKENKRPKATCKCYSKGKQKSTSKPSPSMSQDDKCKPCQESHDDIIRAISKKYNGEILCIHNPPCILINGCLNLSSPRSNVQGNLWPATQSKKYSFIQMSGKMKRYKQKTLDTASQYHPPFAELPQYLPEFQSEKTIQSICNHDPPCEIVHGCYRAQYDPKLQNSCVHVPMCGKLPECLLIEKNHLCKHNPKCAELPLCSRKYIVLTAKEEIGTQVRQKVKMVCRHEPHCLMLPKCLSQAISGDYVPYGAIPGCIHNPQCDNIPACCRKSFKQMVSIPKLLSNSPKVD